MKVYTVEYSGVVYEESGYVDSIWYNKTEAETEAERLNEAKFKDVPEATRNWMGEFEVYEYEVGGMNLSK